MNLISWIPALISLLTGIITITASIAIIKGKVDTLSIREAENKTNYTEELKELKLKVELFTKDLQNAMLQLMLLSKEQALVNSFSAKTLESVVKSAELRDHRMTEQESTLKVLSEIVKRIEITINQNHLAHE